MTSEEQKLLYKALCYSLPHGIEVEDGYKNIYTLDPYVFSSLQNWILRPHLRSLDLQLTTQIEHNGERFVPRQKVWAFYEWRTEWDDFIKDGKIEKLPLWLIEKLLEWHFNLFLPKHLYIEKI